MNTILSFLLILLCGLFAVGKTAIAAQGTPTTPRSIVLFSNLAVVTTIEEAAVQKDLPERGKGFILELPASVDTSSLRVTIGGQSVDAILWPQDQELTTPNFYPQSVDLEKTKGKEITSQTLLPEEEKDMERKKLLEIYAKLRKEEAIIRGRVKASKAKIALWEKAFSSSTPEKLEDLSKMESLINDRVPTLNVSLESDVASLLDAKRKLNEAIKIIHDYDKTHRVRIAYVIPSSNVPQNADLQYTYTMASTSFPSYRVNALPEQNKLTIEQLANITLQTPTVWKSVDMSLVFTTLNSVIDPGLPIPWVIDYEKDAPKAALRTYAMAQASFDSMPASNSATPMQQEMSTYRIWNLGKRDISPNESIQTVLASDTHNANFFYTIRPAIDNKGYLTANVNFSAPVEMPYGDAVYAVDGMYVGNHPLSLNGSNSTLYLGSDPQVAAQVNDLEKKRGEQGIIHTEQTAVWDWEITVTNSRQRNIIVHVEDPAPVSQDQSIKVAVSSEPKPKTVMANENNNAVKLLVWEKELKPLEAFVIKHKVQINATNGKALSSQR